MFRFCGYTRCSVAQLFSLQLTAAPPTLPHSGVHIPYVATPATRATYPGLTANEQDYWGTITQIDAQVGRIRSFLVAQKIAQHTWVSITADNGPEVNPAGGQGTGNFENPGLTGGLRGRKRDVTEGGTRVIGLVEYPLAVKKTPGGRTEPRYPIITSDILPTVLDILGLDSFEKRPLDGISLLPFLRGEEDERPVAAGVGIHGSFRFGTTNHVVNGAYRSYYYIMSYLSIQAIVDTHTSLRRPSFPSFPLFFPPSIQSQMVLRTRAIQIFAPNTPRQLNWEMSLQISPPPEMYHSGAGPKGTT